MAGEQRVDGWKGQRVGNSSGSGQKLKRRSLNTQDVIQIHPAHNFVSFGRFGMYVVPNERPTLWLSFSVFYVWKYEVPHPIKIEEYFWWERALNYKICYKAINAINWVQTSALILLQSPEIPRGTKWDGRVTVAGVSMRWRVLERFFLRTSGIVTLLTPLTILLTLQTLRNDPQ